MNSFNIIYIPPTHTDADIYVPTFTRIYDAFENPSPFPSKMKSFLLT